MGYDTKNTAPYRILGRNGVQLRVLKRGIELGEARPGEGFRELFAAGVAEPAEELDGALGGPSGG